MITRFLHQRIRSFQTFLTTATLALLLAVVSGCATSEPKPVSQQTALDRYIAKPDPTYKYRLAKTIPGKGYTAYVLEMVSQTWLTTNEVDRPEWRHWMMVVRPEKVETSTSLLFIGGGSSDNPMPDKADEKLVSIAMSTRSVVSELKNVPNQPLVFGNDGQKRVEDDLIAYTWDKYLRTGDEKWPARLPMTKSAVRAMDTVTSFCSKMPDKGVKVDSFVIAGGSKRGWTTWTTAAVDRRVKAIAPIVIDLLNIEPSFIHHWEAYGFYAPAVQDYERAGIMEWQGTTQYRNLMKIEEPYEYRNRLDMPKYLINATGDQFFLPDSSQFYFNELVGEKYIRYIPNAEHSLKDTDALAGLVGWYSSILNDKPRPKFSWKMEADGSIRVTAIDKPAKVRLWQASNPNTRDFRIDTIGKAWTSTDLTDQGGGVYIGKIPTPTQGWSACLVELTYVTPGNPAPSIYTTQVSVLPNTLPFKFTPPTTHKVAGN